MSGDRAVNVCRLARCAVVILIFFGSGGIELRAQDATGAPTATQEDERRERFLKFLEEHRIQSDAAAAKSPPNSRMQPDMAAPLPLDPLLQDYPEMQKAYRDALQEYYRYHIAGLQQRQRVFEWQHFSSRVIFFVVILLVFAGIYFAALQFHLGLWRARKSDELERPEVTEFAADLKGLRVSSPVLGVIILVISLAFFYLYLVFVYPIQEVF